MTPDDWLAVGVGIWAFVLLVGVPAMFYWTGGLE